MKQLLILIAVAAAAPAAAAPDGRTAPLIGQTHAPSDTRTPDGLVARLYERDTAPTAARDLDRYFARDLAAALASDGAGGEVGAVDGDYRYDAQDFEPKGLSLIPVGSNSVEARFRNFGEAKVVRYQLCARGAGEWRIADVVMPSGSLRALLNLPAAAPGAC